MPRLKTIILYQNQPKIKLFLQKNAKFLILQKNTISPPPPHCEFLAMRLHMQPILQSNSVVIRVTFSVNASYFWTLMGMTVSLTCFHANWNHSSTTYSDALLQINTDTLKTRYD